MTSSLPGLISDKENRPPNAADANEVQIIGTKAETACLVEREVCCVGPFYLRLLHPNYVEAASGADHCLPSGGVDELDEEEDEAEQFEDDIEYLKSLDPKEWKDQDHYRVLGLRTKRIKATDGDIKRAYRQKVLRHHPDKRKAAGEVVSQDDDYFTNITKAWETLGNPIARRAFDSVDPEFDDDLPTPSDIKNKGFYKAFGPVFERNQIWSENRPVPTLGDDSTSREEVEKFYAFWFNFVSWREYSYHDDEEAKSGSDRDTRKWVEKQNKAQRAKLKKEEMTRIRKLVDMAHEADPRVIKFRQQDKEAKQAQKAARQSAIQARKEEEERARQEALQKEADEREKKQQAEKAAQEVQKKQREAVKNALRKERKALRTVCKDNNFYTSEGEDHLQNMMKVESMCDVFQIEELSELSKILIAQNAEEGRETFKTWLQKLEDRLQKERKQVMESAAKGATGKGKGGSSTEWTPDDLALLIKAVNLFPAGTNQRWDVVAQFINQHSSSGQERTAKDVLSKTKGLQSSDYSSIKDAANKKAYQDFERSQKTVPSVVSDEQASQRFDSVSEQQGMGAPWTAEEQKLLEQALRTYNSATPDRWDKIAECVPSRSKKDCQRRFKELAEIVKAKKAAQAKVASK
ncbi:dnaJ homolog subfamily C member 2 [Neocloeon triangulifer]|uniref:dnaJ homolog subfamily C member 2 n=1 Tax=Neocloeon triangulifer TaxID=2078957 RepID=UPI00286EEE3C|nr:dnaJ homolog subfamily C member 2 [Neocloeon triangulifer]